MFVRFGFVVALVLALVGGAGPSIASAAPPFPYGMATVAGSGAIAGTVLVHRDPAVGSKVQAGLTGLTPGAWYRWELRIDDNQCGPQTGGPSPAAGSVLISSAAAFQADAAGQAAGVVASATVVPNNHSYVTFRVDRVGPVVEHACGTVENWPGGSNTWW